jgi:hypothetical protein
MTALEKYGAADRVRRGGSEIASPGRVLELCPQIPLKCLRLTCNFWLVTVINRRDREYSGRYSQI